jgi:Lrp/AsnC family leucine-responsive transcriptional regulator
MLLDEVDCALLAALQERGDVANVELARLVGLSPAATLRRVQRLRAEGAIEAIRAVVAPEAVGLDVEAFVLVTLAEHSARADAAFQRALADLPAVVRADNVTGPEDALLHVVAADARELQRVLLILSRAGAKRLTTMMRLSSYKPPGPLPVRANAPPRGRGA